jgi:predicted nucleic acid-binding protein
MNRKLSALDKTQQALVLDASVIINLLATGAAAEILGSLRLRAIIEETTLQEVLHNPRDGKAAPLLLNELSSMNLLQFETMNADALDIFLDLVGAPIPDDLSDGEAATIAHAATTGRAAVIDERKATRIAKTNYAQVTLCSTLDILSCSRVIEALGAAAISSAVFDATNYARMRISSEFADWVREILGPERAAACRTLRRLR